MAPRDLGNIHTTGRACRDIFHEQHDTKTTPLFYLLIKKLLGCYFQIRSSYYYGGTVQPKNTYFCILTVTGGARENQKRIKININHSYHQCLSPSVSLNWSKDSDSVLTNLIGKDEVRDWSMYKTFTP